MLNEDNFAFYLRYLVQITDSNPLYFNEIPIEYRNFFSDPALSQALNIFVKQIPPIDYSTVESYVDNSSFDNLDEICEWIKNTFTTDIEKLYAIYYYITHNIEYDWDYFENNNSIFDPAVKTVFKNKKGICGDYSRLFIKIAQRSGVNKDIIKYSYYLNYCKGSTWNAYDPPKNTRIARYSNLHACLTVEIQNEKYMSEPTWGSGFVKDKVFTFNYKKSLFLIPFNKGLLQHYPFEYSIPTFSWNQYISINKVNLEQEVSLESNPFQVVNLKNGIYELQFSLIQNSEPISANFQFLNEGEFNNLKPLFVMFTCVDNELPNHYFTYHPECKRVRYKATVYLARKGAWKVNVYREKRLFDIFFNVDDFNGSLPLIPTCSDNRDVNGFYPIAPTEGISQINGRFARIRFAINNKRSPLLIYEFYKIKSGTFERESDQSFNNLERSFSTEIYEEIELNEKYGLVEKWISIQFPSNGRWEVCIYLKDNVIENESFHFFVTYFFDVSNVDTNRIQSPLFDLPKTRKFTSLHFNENYSISPSSSCIITKDFEFCFHVLSKEEIVDFIGNVNDDKVKLYPSVHSEKVTDIDDVRDREYQVKFPCCGHYKLFLKGIEDDYEHQQFFVVDSDLQDESDEEKVLISNLKKRIEDEIDYNADIPINVKENVQNMLSIVPNRNELKTIDSCCCLLI